MDYMEDTDWLEQVQDAVGGLLARPPLKRAKPEEDGEDPQDGHQKGKGRGKGKGKNRHLDNHQPQQQQLAALQQTMGQLISLTLRHESQLQALASTDQFLLFLPAGPVSLMPNILYTSDTTMERAANQGHLHATTARGTGSDGDSGDPRPLHEAPSHGPTRSPLAEGDSPAHHHSRGLVALPAMGSDSEEASSVAQQDPYQGGEDSESPGGPSGAHEEPCSPAAVQKSPTATDLQEDSDPLPDPGQHERQPPVRHSVVPESQLSLDAGGGQTPTAHGPPDAVGEPDPQGSRTRWPFYLDQGLATVMGWKLINQQNACWLNATMVSFLWAHLQCRGLHWQDLGIGTEMFPSLCSRTGPSPG